jgi:L,D-peptidoglycan transpeptidase YkuD (ErfK/YbiS/YcfS/YnhG family)
MARTIVLGLCVALCAAGAAVAGPGAAPACPATLANELTSTGSAKQLITVLAPRRSSTSGELRLWRKSAGCWLPAGGPWPAWLGQKGVSEEKFEGDRTTPAGVFGFGPVMYGVAPDPGVQYSYRRVVCGDWWVEDPRSRYYNRFRRTPCGSRPPFRTVGGDLSASPTAYRHFAVIAYNVSPVVPGRGSGIFLHVSTGRPTLGCVSLSRSRLVAVLRWLRPASEPLIVIGTPAMMQGY